jgi:phosphopantothenate---cysteine ligase (CTP)
MPFMVNVHGDMKCIVTAGPTYEELDDVRRMTNFSTGTLGTELANYLAARKHEVVLLRGHYSTCTIKPKTAGSQVFTTTSDLGQLLDKLASKDVGAVFHAAAVSDFMFGKIWRRTKSGAMEEIKSRKIPTRGGSILAELEPTPKLIRRLRGWFPKAFLAGWKYEVEGDRKTLLLAASQQMQDNETDACVINGPAYGDGFGLVTPSKTARHLKDKTALFVALLAELKTERRGQETQRRKES